MDGLNLRPGQAAEQELEDLRGDPKKLRRRLFPPQKEAQMSGVGRQRDRRTSKVYREVPVAVGIFRPRNFSVK